MNTCIILAPYKKKISIIIVIFTINTAEFLLKATQLVTLKHIGQPQELCLFDQMCVHGYCLTVY